MIARILAAVLWTSGSAIMTLPSQSSWSVSITTEPMQGDPECARIILTCSAPNEMTKAISQTIAQACASAGDTSRPGSRFFFGGERREITLECSRGAYRAAWTKVSP